MFTQKNNIFLLLVGLLFCLSSCDAFLDPLPDNRVDLDTPEKVKELLTSAYTNLHPQLIGEMMSDNTTDNGKLYREGRRIMGEMYAWKDATSIDWDTPHEIWDAAYRAIAHSNQALETLKKFEITEQTRALKSEALLCRAYHHFLLANVFCMSYAEETAKENLGLPYPTKPLTTVGVEFSRGTLEKLYEKINQDIEEALENAHLLKFDVPLYHFNRNAAYAFAAEFNLYYRKDFDKVIKYSNEVLGTGDPSNILRDLKKYTSFTKPLEWTYAYINKEEPANLLLMTNRSIWGREYSSEQRYTHGFGSAAQTFWSKTPAGDLQRKPSVYATSMYGNPQVVYTAKSNEIFEYTDVRAGTGQPHVIAFAFTTDATLLCRAEAYVLKGEYEAAATDLSYWYKKKGLKAVTADEISAFYQTANPKTIGKPLNPKFKIEPGMQTHMLQGVLQARRVERIHEGVRFIDIKRYGIEIAHRRENNSDNILSSNDSRTAVQLPASVVAAGLEKNPRSK